MRKFPECRKYLFKSDYADPLNILRIPFFYEPNFDALVKPLAAAKRLQEGDPKVKDHPPKIYEPIQYGKFLMGKVGNNFSTGKGKYD
jgi:isopenicillin N synthase-like dioxygenase